MYGYKGQWVVTHDIPTSTSNNNVLAILFFGFSFQVPPLGHIPRILARMKASNEAIPKSCVQVINVLAESEVQDMM